MTDRIPLDDLTSDALDQLYARAERAEAAIARVRQMTTHWEECLPDTIRTPAVVSALLAATDPAR